MVAMPLKDVGKVPGWLGAPSKFASGSNLLNLFQPQRELRVLFRFATAFLVEDWLRRALRCARALWVEILLGLIPNFVFFYLSWPIGDWRIGVVVILLGLFVTIAGIAFAGTLGVLVRIGRLSNHYYGLCTGYKKEEQGRPLSLIGWSNERLNTMSDMPSGRPITFGDLKNCGITLKMISTCLTFGRPYTLPFESGTRFFKRSYLSASLLVNPRQVRSAAPALLLLRAYSAPAATLVPSLRTEQDQLRR